MKNVKHFNDFFSKNNPIKFYLSKDSTMYRKLYFASYDYNIKF